MSQVGLNFACPESLRGVDIDELSIKDSQLDEECMFSLATFADERQFSSSEWNRRLTPFQITFQLAHKHKDGTEEVCSCWSLHILTRSVLENRLRKLRLPCR